MSKLVFGEARSLQVDWFRTRWKVGKLMGSKMGNLTYRRGSETTEVEDNLEAVMLGSEIAFKVE